MSEATVETRMPMPEAGEDYNDFMDRCMGDGYGESQCDMQWENNSAKPGTGLKVGPLPAKSEWLRANIQSDRVGVDRQNNVIHGYVVAQEGPFKTDGRGEFDHKSLSQIVRLMKAAPNGLKSRLGHPSLSDDGIGKFLGRSKNPRLDSVTMKRDGEKVTLEAVRADLHLSPSSFDSPAGNIGQYILDLAASDSEAFSSSLVLQVEEEMRLDSKGRPKLDDAGKALPPLWRPTKLHASDVVDTGDAVDGFLSADYLPDGMVRQVSKFLDTHFAGLSREVIEARLLAFLDKELDRKFGPKEDKGEKIHQWAVKARQEAQQSAWEAEVEALTIDPDEALRAEFEFRTRALELIRP